ncbi:ferredoxin--NADP reductase [Tomitella biformata]|uniref:ferredoxin--NADP reductase n=1 Tax=Tomitella biformata TaxID=630403 RepID=UPI000465C23F|nr:ferredoxin--NADP reductase [Tomitella biformata]
MPEEDNNGLPTNIGLVGSHVHTLKLARVVAETDDARSLVFEIPVELSTRFAYEPGQFLTLRIPSERTGSVARSYSLSSSPFADDELTVTVKRTIDGYASNWLCDNAAAGLELEVLQPSGMFVPKNLDTDLLLIAAGSGVTPVMSILKSALLKGSAKVTLIYANRDEGSVIFAEELRDLQAKHPDRLSIIHWIQSLQGLPSQTTLGALAAPFHERDAFICGPGPFMAAAETALKTDLGMPHARVHVEVFQSIDGDPFAEIVLNDLTAEEEADAAQVEVILDGETHNFAWPRNTKLLDLLLSKGLDAPFSCRQGACSACACIVTEGDVSMLINEVLEPEDIADGIRLGCQSLPLTDIVKVSYDE